MQSRWIFSGVGCKWRQKVMANSLIKYVTCNLFAKAAFDSRLVDRPALSRCVISIRFSASSPFIRLLISCRRILNKTSVPLPFFETGYLCFCRSSSPSHPPWSRVTRKNRCSKWSGNLFEPLLRLVYKHELLEMLLSDQMDERAKWVTAFLRD